MHDTKLHFSANFVGIVVGFLNVCIIPPSSLPPRYLLNATRYKNILSGMINGVESRSESVKIERHVRTETLHAFLNPKQHIHVKNKLDYYLTIS